MSNYVAFYMQGRSDTAGAATAEVDIGALATRVIAGEDMYTITQAAAAAVYTPAHAITTAKALWQKKNARAIVEYGGDKEKAYEQYLKGQVAELRFILEDETCDEIEEQLEDEDEEDEEDEAAEDEVEAGDADDPDADAAENDNG